MANLCRFQYLRSAAVETHQHGQGVRGSGSADLCDYKAQALSTYSLKLRGKFMTREDVRTDVL